MDQNTPVSHDRLASQYSADASRPARPRRHRWIWAVVLLAFGLLFYWVISHEQKSQPAAAGGGRRMMGGNVALTTATAHKGDINIYLDAIGTVTPLHTVAITSQVTGTVTAVHYREGQLVHQGDPLIDIDARQFQAQLKQAQGTLERDQSLLAQGKMDLERYRQAWAKNAIPRQTLEDQEKIVLQQQGTVKNDEGLVQYDEVQLSYCHIKSPITGRVGLRLVDPGNLVTANSTTTLVVVTQQQPITVIFTVAEDSLPQVMKHSGGRQPLQVEALDRTQQGHLATGKLTSIDNQIDTTTGTVKLRAEFDNREGVLFPNQFVNTRLLVNQLTNQVLVPSSAIQHNGNEDYVYVLADAKTGSPVTQESDCSTAGSCKAIQTDVKTGPSDRGDTVIVQGLQAGEVVANSSFEKLQNNFPVTIARAKLPSTNPRASSTAP